MVESREKWPGEPEDLSIEKKGKWKNRIIRERAYNNDDVQSGIASKHLVEVKSSQELGAILRDKRKARNLQLKEAAKIFGISESSLSRIETGERMASAKLLHKIAEEYGIPSEMLFFVTDCIKSNKNPSQEYSALANEFLKEIIEGRISGSTANGVVDALDSLRSAVEKAKGQLKNSR